MLKNLLLASVFAGASLACPPEGAAAVNVVVAKDGSGTHTTVQAGIDAVSAGGTISVKPGTYHEVISVPAGKTGITLRGTTGKASDVVVDYDNANGTKKPDGSTYGTSGSATATIAANGFTATALTFRNSFDRKAHPEIKDTQAVAVKTTGDRMVFDNVTFLGHQDTLYADTAAVGTVGRQYYRDCSISGDVDFIFGRATAVLDRCTIHSLDRGSTTNNGYITAASTSISNPYGFLFTGCKFTGTAPAGTVFLGRPWHPSNDPNAIAQTVIRDSKMAAHINTVTPWSDFGVFSWRDARYGEFNNRGDGATPGPDRPQLTAEQAAGYTPATYLGGADGWDPTR